MACLKRAEKHTVWSSQGRPSSSTTNTVCPLPALLWDMYLYPLLAGSEKFQTWPRGTDIAEIDQSPE